MKALIAIGSLVPGVGTLVATVTAPPVAGMVAPITVEDKIQALLWAIGILVTIVGAMMVAVLWFLRDIKNRNGADHERIEAKADEDSQKQWEHINENEQSLSNLLGQHEVAFSLRGCAYEPQNLKNVMRDIFMEIMEDYTKPRPSHVRTRATDAVQCTCGGDIEEEDANG